MQKAVDTGLSFFREQCRKHNLRITPQRTAIYRIISQSCEHPNTEQIFQKVREEFPNISFDTIHRTFLTFAKIKLIDKVECFGNSRRFDPNSSIHHHLYCEKCGKITDFTYAEYDKLKIPVNLTNGFKVKRKRVVIIGFCQNCSL